MGRLLETSRGQWFVVTLVLALAAGSLGYRVGEAPINRHSAQRCFEVVRDMFQSGDWLVPTMGGRPRLEKPPLFYWASTVSSKLLGGVSRLSLRLTSVFAGLGLLLLIFLWGRSLGGARTGLVAMVFLLMMGQFSVLGRRGDAEMTLAFLSMLGLFLFDRSYWNPRRGQAWVFSAVFILAFLAKATTAVLIIGLPSFLFLWKQHQLSVLFQRRTLAFALLVIAGCLAWYIAILITVPGGWETIRSEMLLPLGLKAGAGSAAHYRPIYYYFYIVIIISIPALFALPLLVIRVRESRFWRDTPRGWFLFITPLSLFVAFSLIPQKQRHYMLPLLPPLALLLAQASTHLARHDGETLWRWLRRFGGLSLGLSFVLVLILPVYFHQVPIPGPGFGWVAGAVVVGAGITAWKSTRQGLARSFTAAVLLQTLGMLILYTGSFGIWQQEFDAGTVEQRSDFNAARWQELFERWPASRRLFHARHWEGPIPTPEETPS